MSLLLRWSVIRPKKTPDAIAAPLFSNPSSLGQLRNASLSAIHRGIHRSERAGSQSKRFGRSDFRPRKTESRSRGRPQSSATPPPQDAFADRFSKAVGLSHERHGHHFKPKKALQKMQEPEEGGRKSRSKRFNNPEFSFGKKSMVYQLNRGEMRDKVEKLLDKGGREESSRPPVGSAWRQNFGSDIGRDDRTPRRSATHEDRPPRRSNFERDSRHDDRAPRRSVTRGDDPPRRSNFERDSGRDEARERFASSRDGSSRRTEFRRESGRDSARSMRDGARRELEDGEATSRPSDFPVSIQYTTAASQFLFGRSVVKAALKNSRRKLYQLYIYQGSNKKETRDDEWILSLAQKKNVKVNIIYEGDQKLLDKMSMGRPNNGLVLEASPLPQLPLDGLGGESSESNGYTVNVGRQSKEDAEINGTEGFIPCKAGAARPLVLLLNEILDPGNLGAMLRTARFLGVSAVAITQRTSSAITSTVLKAAAGAAEELRLFSVQDPVAFLDASQKAGWTSFAAVAPTPWLRTETRQWTPDTIEQFNPLTTQPCILVLGNEGSGLPHDVRKKANHEVTIPRLLMTSSVDSLNVSVATALLCNSFVKGTRERDSLSLGERLQLDARKADAGEGLF